MSVPDSDLLITLSEVLDTPVSTLLGETVTESEADTIKVIAEKLEILNLQFAQRKSMQKAILHWLLISLCVIIVTVSAVLILINSPYLTWDYGNPEIAVAGTVFHALEWLFVRLAPIVLIAAIVGVCLTKKHKSFF